VRKLFAVLLLVASGSAAAYDSLSQSWTVLVNPPWTASEGTVASPAAALVLINTNHSGAIWTQCGAAPAFMYYNAAVAGCGTPSFHVNLIASSCTAGDTLSSDGMTCTAAGGGGTGTPPAAGASTGSSGDNGSGLASWLNGKINAVLSWLLSIISSVFVGLWTLLTDFFIFILDQLFDLVLYIVGGMSWDFGAFSPATYWAMLPADLISVLNLIGVPIALGMIVAALGIRFVLQLIPFVRWGS
jgi:hypothetical protein